MEPSVEVIEVGLADANPLMLGALSEFFDQDPRFSLVFTAGTAEGFLDVAKTTEIGVGVIDWSLPSLGGQRLIEIMRARALPTKLIVYADGEQGDVPRAAMSAGAAGFCARNEPPERLLSIVTEVAKGQMVFPFLDVRELSRDPIEALTARERLLLQRLSTGLSNKGLAKDLDVSINTIKFHLRNLYEKLAVTSRTQAIALYFSQMNGHLPQQNDDYAIDNKKVIK
jgi:two-component system nitrate/nitrite response regulator NarP